MLTKLPRRAPAIAGLMLLAVLAACGQAAPSPTTAATQPPNTEPAPVTSAAPTAAVEASPSPTAAEVGPQTVPEWTVEIIQGGQTAATETGQVNIARAPFTLQVTLPEPLPVKLNANADDANFVALQPGYVFTEDCVEALCTGMDVAEERLNPTQVLFVDPQSTHYLYYQGPDDHRWSRATVDENSAVFERDVALLNDVPIEQYTNSELYLLLFVDLTNPGTIDPGELKKIALLLN